MIIAALFFFTRLFLATSNNERFWVTSTLNSPLLNPGGAKLAINASSLSPNSIPHAKNCQTAGDQLFASSSWRLNLVKHRSKAALILSLSRSMDDRQFFRMISVK